MSKNNEVYDYVVARLVSARYAFGEKLLVKQLGVETGASRQPIMAALNRLSVDGFVRIIPQVGCQVVDPDRQEIADFFLMFQSMEGLLAELAATRRTENGLRQLQTAHQRILAFEQGNNTQNGAEYAELNREFHQSIHQLAQSPLLDAKQRSNFNMSDFFITHSTGFTSFLHSAMQSHHDILDAIEKGQPRLARLFTEAHIASISGAVLAGLDAGKPKSSAV